MFNRKSFIRIPRVTYYFEGNDLMVSSPRFIFGRSNLLSLKLKARRSGVWFKVLSRLDRELVNLTIEVADEVRSLRLAEALSTIARKVEDSLKTRISKTLCEIGFPLARRLGSLAKKWGNAFAQGWMSDLSFAKFLAIMHINDNRRITMSST
jgi:hypothetical protein